MMSIIFPMILRKTKYRDGQLVTTGGTCYKAIILPAVKMMPDDVLKHLLALARQGATLVFVG